MLYEERIWDGYGMVGVRSHDDIAAFEEDLDNYIEGFTKDDCDHPQSLYWEIGDWLDDNVCTDADIYKDQEDVFTVRLKIKVIFNGNDFSYHFLPAIGKPEWQD